MAPSDTPPQSPSLVREEDEEEELLEDDAVEIIDLDEDQQGMEEEEDLAALDDSIVAQAASEASMGIASNRLESPPEDNSVVTFSEHGSEMICHASWRSRS